MRTRTESERAAFRQRIHDYERTEVWAARSRRFRATRKLQQCLACRKPGIEDVHHVTYERALRSPGKEPDSDLRGLCHRCHMAIHKLTPSRGGSMSLWDATNFVLAHTARWDVVPGTRAQPWRYTPAVPVRRRRSWWRRNLVPLLVLVALLVWGVVQVWGQLPR
jgi:hypothetical protein